MAAAFSASLRIVGCCISRPADSNAESNNFSGSDSSETSGSEEPAGIDQPRE